MMNQVLSTIAATALLLGLAACAGERPQSTTTPGLNTGITNNNGGGQRALGNTGNVGITTQVSPVR